MRIFIFIIDRPKLFEVFQIYATSRLNAKASIQIITGYGMDEINFIGEEETTEPQKWEH